MNKFFVFHVPYTKSARLANLINTGTPPGCGYRRIATVQTLGGNAHAKSDLHAEGSAVVFSNLDVACWKFSDIIASCIELDFGASKEISFVDPNLTDDSSDMAHLFHTYVNASLEPFNYVRDYNYSFNPDAIDATTETADTVNSIVAACFSAVPEAVLNINFPTKTVTDADHNSTAYLKNWFKQVIAPHTEHVLVPVQNQYFTKLFTNISKQMQNGMPALYTSVMRLTATTDPKDAKNLRIAPVTYGYPVNNKGVKSTKTGKLAFSIDFGSIDAFQFAISSADFQLIPVGKYANLRDFISGTGTDFVTGAPSDCSMRCMQLVDNYAISLPPNGTDYRSRVENNALSQLWHLSYANISTPFQSPKAATERVAADMLHMLNLEGLVN
jgi:hypothetical protein